MRNNSIDIIDGRKSFRMAAVVPAFLLLASAFSALATASPAAYAASNTKWYFAEGYAREGFQEYVALANSSGNTAQVILHFMFNGGRIQDENMEVAAQDRLPVNVNRTVGENREVSVIVEFSTSELVERFEMRNRGQDQG